MFLIGNLGISCIHSTDRAGSRGREQWTTLSLSRVIIDFMYIRRSGDQVQSQIYSKNGCSFFIESFIRQTCRLLGGLSHAPDPPRSGTIFSHGQVSPLKDLPHLGKIAHRALQSCTFSSPRPRRKGYYGCPRTAMPKSEASPQAI